MTPDPELGPLLKAFEEMRRVPRARSLNFIAGNQTYSMADFRRAADKAPRDVGEVLHALLDCVGWNTGARGDDVWNKLEEQRVKIAELRASAKLANRRIRRVLKFGGIKRYTTIRDLLREARDELEADTHAREEAARLTAIPEGGPK